MSVERESPEEVLRRRARGVAEIPESEISHEVFAQVALLQIGREVIGVPDAHLREIVAAPRVTRLPGTPAWITGIVQVRGELMSAVDLISLYGLRGEVEAAYMAVLENKRGALGVLVGDVIGFQTVMESELAAQLLDLEGSDLPILGVTRDLVVLLDTNRLLEEGRLLMS